MLNAGNNQLSGKQKPFTTLPLFKNQTMKKVLLIPLLALSVLLAACGAKIDGTYADEMGVTSYTFKSGKVIVSALGMGTEMDYKVEDNKVKITSPKAPW